MKSSLNMFGIKVDIEVPNKPKKKRRGKSKALASPRKDKMMRVNRIKAKPLPTEESTNS